MKITIICVLCFHVDRSWNRGKYLSRERGIPRSQWSTTVGECVPVLCTHRPSLLLIGPLIEPAGEIDVSRRSKSRNKVIACTWWNRPEEDNSSGKLESTHPSRTSVKSDQGFFGVESVMRVNADSLLILAAATSTSGTLNDLTTDLIMANNNNNNAVHTYSM